MPSRIATIRPNRAVRDEVHRDVRERRRDDLVERVRLAAAQVVGQLDRQRLDAGPARELGRERLADVGLAAVAEGVRLAELLEARAAPRSRPRPRRRSRSGSGSGGGPRRGRPASASRSYGASGITHRADVTYAANSAENPASRPKIRNTPIRSWLPSVVRCRSISSFARVIADEKPMQYSVPGTSLSIVFGMATSGTPLVDQDPRERQRVVAADRHEGVDAQRVEVLEHDRRQVVAVLVGPVALGRGRCRASRAATRAFIRAGFVREVWSTVPPVRSIVRVLRRSSGRR